MTNIVDYTHTVYYFKGLPFSFTDFFRSPEWVEFVRHGKGEVPLTEGIHLLMRLAAQKGFPVDTSQFGAIVCGDEKEGDVYDAFVKWKKLERRHELKRIQIMDRFLAKNRCYPYILYPLFNQKYTSTEKAQQLYATINVWDTLHMKRLFFALVFKYSKRLGAKVKVQPNLNVIINRDRKSEDPLYAVYMEASNGLWDYIEYLDGKVEVVGRRQKKREGCIFSVAELEHEWLEWMSGRRVYDNLLEYQRNVNRRERARFTVFMEFLWMYLKRDNLVDDAIPTKHGNSREQHLKIRKVLE